MSYPPPPDYPPPPPPPPPPPGGGYPYGYGPAPSTSTNQKAVFSLVLGIISLFCCGLVLGLVAILLGFLARSEIDSTGGAQSGSGLALAGMILGALGIISGIGLWVFGFYGSFI